MSKISRISLVVLIVLLGAAALAWPALAFGRFMGWGMGGFYPGGMMGAYGYGRPAEPLSVEEAAQAVETYLRSLGNEDLSLKEIMVFENNAYAIVAEESTGRGAFELLVDPLTRTVFPEYGPNMMWNLKYGMMGGAGYGYGMMGYGMMGGFAYGGGTTPPEVAADLPVSPQEALDAARRYLTFFAPGVQVSDEITAFYGYYTIDVEKDGQIVGMLSVNGFTRQVFPHTWHGKFLQMVEMEADS